jgi:hypothetical protein
MERRGIRAGAQRPARGRRRSARRSGGRSHAGAAGAVWARSCSNTAARTGRSRSRSRHRPRRNASARVSLANGFVQTNRLAGRRALGSPAARPGAARRHLLKRCSTCATGSVGVRPTGSSPTGNGRRMVRRRARGALHVAFIPVPAALARSRRLPRAWPRAPGAYVRGRRRRGHLRVGSPPTSRTTPPSAGGGLFEQHDPAGLRSTPTRSGRTTATAGCGPPAFSTSPTSAASAHAIAGGSRATASRSSST